MKQADAPYDRTVWGKPNISSDYFGRWQRNQEHSFNRPGYTSATAETHREKIVGMPDEPVDKEHENVDPRERRTTVENHSDAPREWEVGLIGRHEHEGYTFDMSGVGTATHKRKIQLNGVGTFLNTSLLDSGDWWEGMIQCINKFDEHTSTVEHTVPT